MYSKINFLTPDDNIIKLSIQNFIYEIAERLSNNVLLTENLQDFYIMIDNFEQIINYLNINEQWIIRNITRKKTDLKFAQTIRENIENIMIAGIINEQYNNLIFEFHRYTPFTNSINTIYKWLINSLLHAKKIHQGIDIKLILSAYLTHAASYNHHHAIKILIEDYHVSPIKIWLTTPAIYKKFHLTIMPIIHITNPELINTNNKSFTTSRQQQEYYFLFMLNKIDFAATKITEYQVQDIFRCVFKNLFLKALDNLLDNKYFCEKLEFTETDLIMLALGSIIIPSQYNNLINKILNHPNIINKPTFNIQEIQSNIEHFIKILRATPLIQITKKYHNFVTLNMVSDFIKTSLMINEFNNNVSFDLLLYLQKEIEQLKQENTALQRLTNQLAQYQLDTKRTTNHVEILAQFYQLRATTNYLNNQNNSIILKRRHSFYL